MVKIFGTGSYGKLKSWVTTKIATHKADASAHHSKYTDAEVDTIVAAHTAITSAHHSKYTDAEVDTIVAAHTAIASAHHSKYTDAEAVSAMGAKGDANPLHHDKYTDSEVDAILSVHTALASAHHSKYLDAEAVSAVAAADNYVENSGDEITGSIVANWQTSIPAFRHKTRTAESGLYICGGDDYTHGAFLQFNGDQCSVQPGYGKIRFGSSAIDLNAEFEIRYNNPTANVIMMSFNGKAASINIHDSKIKNPKNHAASALTGTKKLVEIDIGGTPYYYEVYPTKA